MVGSNLTVPVLTVPYLLPVLLLILLWLSAVLCLLYDSFAAAGGGAESSDGKGVSKKAYRTALLRTCLLFISGKQRQLPLPKQRFLAKTRVHRRQFMYK